MKRFLLICAAVCFAAVAPARGPDGNSGPESNSTGSDSAGAESNASAGTEAGGHGSSGAGAANGDSPGGTGSDSNGSPEGGVGGGMAEGSSQEGGGSSSSGGSTPNSSTSTAYNESLPDMTSYSIDAYNATVASTRSALGYYGNTFSIDAAPGMPGAIGVTPGAPPPGYTVLAEMTMSLTGMMSRSASSFLANNLDRAATAHALADIAAQAAAAAQARADAYGGKNVMANVSANLTREEAAKAAHAASFAVGIAAANPYGGGPGLPAEGDFSGSGPHSQGI